MNNALILQVNQIRDALANPAAINQQLVNEIGAQLGMFYQAAEESGNQNAMEIIANTWSVVQAAENFRASAVSAVDLAAEIEQQRAAAVEQLTELERAIEEIDLENKKVADFWNTVEENVHDQAEEAAYEYVSEADWDDLYQELSTAIQQATGLDKDNHAHFIDAIRGEVPITEEEAAQLRAVVLQINTRINAEHEAWRQEHSRRIAAQRAAQGR